MGKYGGTHSGQSITCEQCGRLIMNGHEFWIATPDSRPNATVCSADCMNRMESSDKMAVSAGIATKRGMFARDLDAGRAAVDAAGFGLVADMVGGGIKLGKKMAQKAKEEEIQNRNKSVARYEERTAYINNLEISGNDEKSIKKSMDELFSTIDSMISGSGYEDINAQYERLTNIGIRKAIAGIALFRGLSGADVKAADKMQLKLQGYQKQALKGKGKYAEIMGAFNNVSFDGGEKLIQKNLKTLLSTWGSFSLYSKVNQINFADRQVIAEEALKAMEKGLTALSNISGYNEKFYADISQKFAEANASKSQIKGTSFHIISISVSGEQKQIITGFNQLFDLIKESKKQIQKGASASILKRLGDLAVNRMVEGVENLTSANVAVDILDEVKIKLLQSRANIMTFERPSKYDVNFARVETTSFDGGFVLLKNQIKKLAAICPKGFALSDLFTNEKLNRDEKQNIATLVSKKMDEALDALNNVGNNPEKDKLLATINKTKEQVAKLLRKLQDPKTQKMANSAGKEAGATLKEAGATFKEALTGDQAKSAFGKAFKNPYAGLLGKKKQD